MTFGSQTSPISDPKGLAQDISGVGHFGTGDYGITVSDSRDIEYIMSLIKPLVR